MARLVAPPSWIYEALRALSPDELKELATKAGISLRHLQRLRSYKPSQGLRMRSGTLERLRAYLKSPPLTHERLQEITKQILEENDVYALYCYLIDGPRVGLRIHELLVQRGWVPMDLAQEIKRMVYERAGLKPKVEVDLEVISKKELPGVGERKEILQLLLTVLKLIVALKEIGEYERDAQIAREMGLPEIPTSRIEEITLGGVALPDELELIAHALGVDIEEIFCATPSGIKIFREALVESSKKSKYRELNRRLNELRVQLGIRLD